MPNTTANSSPNYHPNKDIVGHLFKVGQRVERRQNNSSRLLFGEPRKGVIVELTWKKNKRGSVYPTYAVKFDKSSVIDRYVMQMRLYLID